METQMTEEATELGEGLRGRFLRCKHIFKGELRECQARLARENILCK